MSPILIKGRDPGQVLDVALARSAKAFRRIWLPLRRRGSIDAERRYSPAELRWILDESAAQGFLSAYPACHAEILQEADLAKSGWANVPGFGQRAISLRAPTSQDPVEIYSHRILCRLDFLRPLARAALISAASADYVRTIESLIGEWEKAQLAWRSRDTVDDSIRVLNLLEVFSLLKRYLNNDAISKVISCIIDAAWNIEINRTRTGNHLIYEGLALMAVGYGLPEHPRASRWFSMGRCILEKQMHRQVRPDGFNAELSMNYHLITGTNFLKGWLIAHAAGKPMQNPYRKRLDKMIFAAAQLRADDGGFPALGDSDRMSRSSREEREARAFAYIASGFPASESSEAKFERAWMLAGNDFKVRGEAISSVQSQPFNAGGYYLLSRSSGPRIIFDAGPFGLRGASHHGHADNLSLEIHLQSGRFWVDPGGFSYVDYQARAFARSTAAHNTIQVDGRSSSEITGPFGFGRGAQTRCLKAQESGPGFLLVGEHDGYKPIIHRRALFWLPGDSLKLLLLDRLEGQGDHAVESFFHADAGWSAIVEPGLVCWRKGELEVVQLIRAETDLQSAVIAGQTDPALQGWVSPTQGNWLPAPTLRLKCAARLPFEMASLVVEGANDLSRLHLDLKNRSARIDALELGWKWIGATPEIIVGN